jgi:hypothetical protein
MQNWYHTYKQTYNIEWGNRQWLTVPTDDKWKNKIIINTTNYRWPHNIDFTMLQQLYPDDLVFISANKDQHDIFENTTNIKIHYHEITSFLELSTIINSCKFFAGSLSAPLAIAHALHKERICGLSHGCSDNTLNMGLNKIFTNLRYSV